MRDTAARPSFAPRGVTPAVPPPAVNSAGRPPARHLSLSAPRALGTRATRPSGRGVPGRRPIRPHTPPPARPAAAPPPAAGPLDSRRPPTLNQ